MSENRLGKVKSVRRGIALAGIGSTAFWIVIFQLLKNSGGFYPKIHILVIFVSAAFTLSLFALMLTNANTWILNVCSLMVGGMLYGIDTATRYLLLFYGNIFRLTGHALRQFVDQFFRIDPHRKDGR